jgi:ABC-2 type transport system ATP-binding protein
MIEARQLSKRFGGREAVSGVSFAVAPGEVVGFLGPNGAGKTTVMRLLLGLLRPNAGSASIEGPAGYLPELFVAYDALSVGSYLRFMARMKAVSLDEVPRAMDASGCGPLAIRPVGRLSKGQRQRVGLAQALLGSPPAYVLDEPTQGMDPGQVVQIRDLVRSLASDRGAAVLLSTHLLAEAAAVCDRVVVIVRGRIVAEERPGVATDLEARFLRLVGEGELT